MPRDCKQYATNCSVCRRTKAYNTRKQCLLNPLPIPNRKWTDLSLDFVVELLECHRQNRVFRHILVVVDRLTKQRLYKPLEGLSTSEFIKVMQRRVFSAHGYPSSIVNDRGSQMTSKLWRRLCKRYGIRIKFSSAQHPETNGQTKNANKVMKNYLRAYISHTQDDWVDHLPMSEFLANNHVSESTGVTPFFADNGFHPRMGVEYPQAYEGAGRRAELMAADKIVANQKEMVSYLQDQLTWAQQEQTHWANQNRQPHPEYKVGDMVYVDARHFASERDSKSLSMKNAGPWKIVRNIGNKAYELDIPQQMKDSGLTPIFHPWKLHLAPSSPFSGQILEPELPILVSSSDGSKVHKEWEVLEVVDSQKTKRYGVQYKATYMSNWDEWNSNPTWQPYNNFENAKEKIRKFHRTHLQKLGPPSELGI